MRPLPVTFLLLAMAAGARAQTPAAVFDAAYQAAHRGRIVVEVPEVYELVNVAIALTPTGISSSGLVYQRSDYYERVRRWFDPHRGHPLIPRLDEALGGDTWEYFSLKMNGYAFRFDEQGRIVQSEVYDRTGFRSDATNTLRPFLADLQSFADASRFREFYAANAAAYDELADYYRREAGIEHMKAWLERHFPGSSGYDAYKIIFSPLVFGNQSSTWFESNGFRELQPHVNYPYPAEVPRWGAGDLSPRAAVIFRGAIVFTEINHGYINPEASKYRPRILQAASARERWVSDRFGPGYYAGTGTFNEYMNWALLSLWFADAAPEDELPAMIGSVERLMTERRGFLRFAAFNQFLLDLYRARRPGQTVADLYPRIIAWFERENRGGTDGADPAGGDCGQGAEHRQAPHASEEHDAALEVLFLVSKVLIAVPGLPVVPALGLGLLAASRWKRLTRTRRAVVLAGVAPWAGFAAWQLIRHLSMQPPAAPGRAEAFRFGWMLLVSAGTVLILCGERPRRLTGASSKSQIDPSSGIRPGQGP